MNSIAKTHVLNASQIKKLLPHRDPFLLLDRVIELQPGKRGVGIKNVTIDEPFFSGHFPDFPIMPGVLIVEALAQLTAVVYASQAIGDLHNLPSDAILDGLSKRVGYLASIRQMKFRKPVTPGDQLRLEVIIGQSLGPLSTVQVKATVDQEIVVEGSLAVSEKPEETLEG